MGPQGSGGTLKMEYSAEEMLKASVSNEGRINVLLWYHLVGAYVGLLPVLGVSGCAWYGDDSPHLEVGPSPWLSILCGSRFSGPPSGQCSSLRRCSHVIPVE